MRCRFLCEAFWEIGSPKDTIHRRKGQIHNQVDSANFQMASAILICFISDKLIIKNETRMYVEVTRLVSSTRLSGVITSVVYSEIVT
jgi:hypothetical protein